MSLLVSDFDGTFYTNERNIKINCEYLKNYISEGNYFVLSSGRSYKSLMNKVKEYNIPYNYLSCCDGSFLFDDTGLYHFAYTLTHDAINIFDGLKNLNKHDKIEYTYLDDYSKTYDKFKMLGSVALTIDERSIDDEFISVYNKIKEEHSEYQYDIYGYGGLYYYLIRPMGVSKALPIQYLEEKLNIDKKDIYTIGDNTNDYELIKEYNGFRIGDNKDIIGVSLGKYDAVYELIDDINKKKVLKR